MAGAYVDSRAPPRAALSMDTLNDVSVTRASMRLPDGPTMTVMPMLVFPRPTSLAGSGKIGCTWLITLAGWSRSPQLRGAALVAGGFAFSHVAKVTPVVVYQPLTSRFKCAYSAGLLRAYPM